MLIDQEGQLLVFIPINFNAIDDMILSERRIGLKQIYEALNISYECFYHIGHVDFCRKDSRMCEC